MIPVHSGEATGGAAGAADAEVGGGAGVPDAEPGIVHFVFVTAAADGPADWPPPEGAALAGALAGGCPLGEDWGPAGGGRSPAGAGAPGACVARVKTDPAAGGGVPPARAASLPEKPLLVKPGVAKPAPVSSRASAAAASVAVVSDADSSSAPSPTGGFFWAAPMSFAADASAFSGLTDLNGLSGLTWPSGSGKRCGLVTLAGSKTPREAGGGLGVALPSDPASAS
jgi:hypothetical protein